MYNSNGKVQLTVYTIHYAECIIQCTLYTLQYIYIV